MIEIKIDDLQGRAIADLIGEHLDSMRAESPPESKHALDLAALRAPDITFWTVWEEDVLLGCGALKELGLDHGELKSMRTVTKHLRKGVARRLLEHILMVAKDRGYRRVSLETGSMPAFEPARRLYLGMGFQYTEPFADYKLDPNSVFMVKELF